MAGRTADGVRYTAPSGAKVFGAGTLQYAWGLDGWRWSGNSASADPRLVTFTMNMLTDMGGTGDSEPPPPSVTVTPATATLPTGATQQFTATLQNATGTVDWSVDGGAANGTITTGGLYTAPATAPAGPVTVRATHTASGATDTATVTVSRADPAADHHPTHQQDRPRRRHRHLHRLLLRHSGPERAVAGVDRRRRRLHQHLRGHHNRPHPHVGRRGTERKPVSGGVHQHRRHRHHHRGDPDGHHLRHRPADHDPTRQPLGDRKAPPSPSRPPRPAHRPPPCNGSCPPTRGPATPTSPKPTRPPSPWWRSPPPRTATGTGPCSPTPAGSATTDAATLTVTVTAATNDAFANAQVITGNSGTVTATNTSATKQTGEPNHAGNAGGASIWYAWTPTVGGSVTIDTAGSSFDTIMGVYTGTAVNALTTVASNDDAPSLVTSRVTFTVAAGTTYRIAIDGYNGLRGNVTLNWLLTPAGVPPANDAFANAQVLTGSSGTITATNVNATKETGEPAQAGNAGGASIWYAWTPTASGSLTIDTIGSAFDTTLGVYTGTAVNALTLRASNDDIASGNTASRVTLTVTAGTTYRISIDGYNAQRGAITLNWVGPAGTTQQPQVTTQPANQTVTAGATATFTAAATGSPTPTVQWQVSTDGGTSYSNIAGATTGTLSLTAVTTAQNDNRYRAVFTNGAGSATSNAATLTVTARPGSRRSRPSRPTRRSSPARTPPSRPPPPARRPRRSSGRCPPTAAPA